MTLPVITFRSLPQDEREWGRTLFDLNQSVRKTGERVFAQDQRFLNQVSAGNKQSTQSVQPLTASDSGGGFAEIAIASQSVQFGFGTVAYNSGTITGLLNSTEYFVYVDDPHYEGGAATYLSTTNANLVTANHGRYYVGYVTTPAPAAPPATGSGGGGAGGGGRKLN